LYKSLVYYLVALDSRLWCSKREESYRNAREEEEGGGRGGHVVTILS